MTIASRSLVFASAVAVGCACGAALAKSGSVSAPKRLALDSAFGDHGVAEFTSLGTQRLDQFGGLAIDPLARHLYVAGSLPAPAVARFDLSGAPDKTFGTGGIAVLPVTGIVGGMLPLDGIVVGGLFDPPAGSGIATKVGAVKLLPDGSGLDPAFGAGGLLSLDPLPVAYVPDRMVSLLRDPADGSYVAAFWRAFAYPAAPTGLIRFSKDGVIDSSFGGDGFVELDFEIRDIAVDSAGRLVVALDDSILRLNTDGTRDMTFGTDGALRDADGAVAYPRSLAITEGDGVVAAVVRWRARGGEALQRWNSDGSLDMSFGRAGRIDLPLRHPHGGGGLPDGIVLVPDSVPGAAPSGDRVFLAGNAVFGRENSRGQSGGWFAELVDESRPRAVRARAYKSPRSFAAGESVTITGLVATPRRVFASGVRRVQTPAGGVIQSPFLLSFDVER